MIAHDKALHFIAGVLLYMVGGFFSYQLGLTLAIGYGIGKEVWDSFGNGHVEFEDFLYTAAGGIVGLIIDCPLP